MPATPPPAHLRFSSDLSEEAKRHASCQNTKASPPFCDPIVRRQSRRTLEGGMKTYDPKLEVDTLDRPPATGNRAGHREDKHQTQRKEEQRQDLMLRKRQKRQ